MEIFNHYPQKNPDTASRTIDSEAVIVLPEKSQVHTLNPVATRIWELADGQHKLSEIISTLENEFDCPSDRIKADSVEFVVTMIEQGLMRLSADQPDQSDG
ncbi:MAG: PqqD family protein [bacterium]|nr:PqqD family protein [bacterium]